LLYLYLLKSKDEVVELLKYHKNEDENQINKKIKVIKSDRVWDTNHYLMNSVFKIVFSAKLLLLIHQNKMTLRNVRIEH